jgi:adenosylcobinamide-GDP ribazoletransferase
MDAGTGSGIGTGAGIGADADPNAQTELVGDPGGSATSGLARLTDGLRLAISTLTIIRVGTRTVDRRTAGVAMAAAPLVGLFVGAAAAGVGQLANWWTESPLVSAVAAIGTLAAVTRALHLDGLADTADALGVGSHRGPGEALHVMKRSDIGPFGVTAIVLVLALQIAALTDTYTIHRGAVAVIAAAIAGRVAVTAACTTPVPPARPEGLGAWVAGSVGVPAAVVVGLLGAAASAGIGLAYVDAQTAALAAAAIPFGVAGALLLLRRCIRRFGGITGDVLGALVETSATIAFFILALRP